jgi:hypothetical protein
VSHHSIITTTRGRSARIASTQVKVDIVVIILFLFLVLTMTHLLVGGVIVIDSGRFILWG